VNQKALIDMLLSVEKQKAEVAEQQQEESVEESETEDT